MRLVFDHTRGFGKMTEQVVFYSPYGAIFEKHEYNKALEEGWFPVDNTIWYQSRSTRINVNDYTPSRTTKKLAKKISFFPDVSLNEYKKDRFREIYKKYREKKKFVSDYSIDDMITNSHGQIIYAYENNIIGFMFFKTIGKNFLAVEFAWDYEKPNLSLGSVNIFYAHRLAKFKKCDYIYMGAGYESVCAYKANYEGFEWWSGYSWMTDKEMYKNLCYSDDKVILNNYKFAI